MAHDDGSIKGGANENPLAVLLIDRRECIVVVKTENEIIKRKNEESRVLSKTRSLVLTKKLVIYQSSSHDNGSKGSAKYLILLSFVITANFLKRTFSQGVLTRFIK